jgi:hypothetical protein
MSKQVALAYYEERNELLEYKAKVWILEAIHVKLLQEVHDKPSTSHLGIGKTLRIIRERYY